MIFKKKSKNRKVTKRPKLYRMSRSVIDWFGLVGKIVFILGALFGSYHFLAHSSYFQFQEVELSGSFQRVTREGIGKLIEVPLEKNLFTVNLREIEWNVKKHPWVKQVLVRLKLPGKIHVHIEEFEPAALLKADELYVMSSEGKVFKKLRPGEVQGLPVITGFEAERLKKFPSYYRTHIQRAFDFLKKYQELPDDRGAGLAEIHYDVTEGITVYTENPRTQIYFGQGGFDEKFERWRRFVVNQGGEDPFFERVDLHVEGKIFASVLQHSSQGETTHGP